MSPLLLTVLFAATLATQAPSGSSLESSLRHAIKASGAEVAVAYRTLDGRDEVLIDPDKTFHAASTMKVPVRVPCFAGSACGVESVRPVMIF